MYRKAKYVVIDHDYADSVIVFSTHLRHADVAKALGGIVRSAGFVEFQSNPQDPEIEAIVFGNSVSLGVSSQPEDAKFIQNALHLKGLTKL